MLYFYYKFHKLVGWGSVTGMILLNMLSGALISNHFDLYVRGPELDGNGVNYIYTKPYCRCGAYALGIGCGMVLYARNHMKKTGATFDRVGDFIAKAVDYTCIR